MPEASSETLVFEPTDIFDFEFEQQPQAQSPRHSEDRPSTPAAPTVSTNKDVLNNTSALLMGDEGLSRPISPHMSTPPPDFDPDENWEDEMAMMEMEKELAGLQDERLGSDNENEDQTQSRISGKGNDKETTGDDFLSTGIFDFDAPVASCRSCSVSPKACSCCSLTSNPYSSIRYPYHISAPITKRKRTAKWTSQTKATLYPAFAYGSNGGWRDSYFPEEMEAPGHISLSMYFAILS